jgi:hypothetical protein
MECFRVRSQLGMQLGSGLHDMHAWAHIIMRSQDGFERRLDTSTGSHGSGAGVVGAFKDENNAGCCNIFRLIREPPADNNARHLCHTLFIDEEPDAECISLPGISKPYIRVRSY